MLYSEENVRHNIRNRDGKRIFYLGQGDQLTPSARDFLHRQRIEILPAALAKPESFLLENGAVLQTKPESYTHLRGNILVPKTHPVIAFRGAMDSLQAQLLLAQLAADGAFRAKIGEILQFSRKLLSQEVMEEPIGAENLLGLSQDELRQHSHRPQDFYDQPHFMPEVTDGPLILQLNLARTAARNAELQAVAAFEKDPRRADLLQALNRLSSAIYLLMIQAKKV